MVGGCWYKTNCMKKISILFFLITQSLVYSQNITTCLGKNDIECAKAYISSIDSSSFEYFKSNIILKLWENNVSEASQYFQKYKSKAKDSINMDLLQILVFEKTQEHDSIISIGEKYFNVEINKNELQDLKHILGRAYTKNGDFIKAKKLFLEVNNYDREIIKYKISQAISNTNELDFKSAISFLNELISKNVSPYDSLLIYANLAVAQGRANKLDSSMININRAIDIKNRYNFHHNGLFGTRANNYLVKGNLENALLDYEKDFLEIDSTDNFNRAVNRLNTGMIYKSKKEYQDGIKYFEDAYEFAKKTKNYNLQQFILRQSGYLHYLEQDYKQAYEHIANVSSLKDSVFQLESQKITQEYETKYETEKTKRENAELIAQKQLSEIKLQRRNYVLGGLAGLLGLIGIFSIILYRRNKRIQQQKEELEVKTCTISLLNAEITHRVKNQFILATELLRRQKLKAEDKALKEIAEESEHSLNAIAAVNKRLDYSSDYNLVDVSEVLSEILDELHYSWGEINGKSILLDKNLSSILLSQEKATYLGLIINELYTNSYKYAFNDIEQPMIKVSLDESNGNISMKYEDNGLGFNSESKGGGTGLIERLIPLMKGKTEILSKNGVHFNLLIPKSN